MKKYVILNLSLKSNSTLENILDNEILKNYPFSSKFKKPVLIYKNILIEIKDKVNLKDYDNIKKEVLINSLNTDIDENVFNTIYELFNDILKEENQVKIDIIGFINDKNLNILYCDGSSSKSLNKASYACCKLTNLNEETGIYDSFSENKWDYEKFSGIINDGTNNIGELNGIKTSLENISESFYQIIISDSMYALKSFREYIYVWKDNGYKTFSKKPIKNQELIKSTFNLLQEKSKNHIIFFKWTEGHANDSFNEKCDEIAKAELGIK